MAESSFASAGHVLRTGFALQHPASGGRLGGLRSGPLDLVTSRPLAHVSRSFLRGIERRVVEKTPRSAPGARATVISRSTQHRVATTVQG